MERIDHDFILKSTVDILMIVFDYKGTHPDPAINRHLELAKPKKNLQYYFLHVVMSQPEMCCSIEAKLGNIQHMKREAVFQHDTEAIVAIKLFQPTYPNRIDILKKNARMLIIPAHVAFIVHQPR